TLIFQLPNSDLAQSFVKEMATAGLGTKNVPDAIDWHFAGAWDHIFRHYGLSKNELWKAMLPSHEILARCIALPVMVKYTSDQIENIVTKLQKIARELL